MSITKDQFENCFREAISVEFSNIPNSEHVIDYTFSEKFDRKMNKLIKSQNTLYWRFINTTTKRVAVVFLVSVIILSSAISVRAIREPVVEFFKEVYDTFVSYFFEGDTIDELPSEIRDEVSDGLSNESIPSLELPKGFVQLDVLENENMISTVFSNDKGDTIEIVKAITEDARLTFDTEHMTSRTIFIENIKIDIFEGDGIKHVVWTDDGLLMLITCCGDISLEDIETMIISLIGH